MTKRKALLLLLLVACIVVAGLVVITTRNREPSYQGRTLSQWLDPRSPMPVAARVHAIRQIGTNALPLLLEWFQSQPSPLELRLSPWLRPLHMDPINTKFRRRQKALDGFAALGDVARPAIPTLARLADSTDDSTAIAASDALGAIGQAALPALLDLMTNTVAYTNLDRGQIAWEFGRLQTSALPAVAVLLQNLNSTHEDVRRAATNALKIIAPQSLQPAQ